MKTVLQASALLLMSLVPFSFVVAILYLYYKMPDQNDA